MTDDMDLDALLAQAAATPVAPSAALTARILADAQALQPSAAPNAGEGACFARKWTYTRDDYSRAKRMVLRRFVLAHIPVV